MPVNFEELLKAYHFVTTEATYENDAFVSLPSGKIYWRTDPLGEENQDLPDDIDDNEKYIKVPSNRKLNLGRWLRRSDGRLQPRRRAARGR
jgi:hypothetical protein